LTEEKEEEDVAFKLLHTADWHLGMRFTAFDEADEMKLTRARLDVVDRLLDLAGHFDVDAVLCAGDLFDDPTPDREWWEGLLASLNGGNRGRSERPIFLLPGNHDPLTSNSVYSRDHPFRRGLPEWVHVVDEDDFSSEIGSGVVLYATPCRSQAGEKDLALSLPERQPGDERLRIGMVHGQTFDIEGHQTNFPIAADAAERRGLDYLAVGDTHGFRDVSPDAPAPIVYPGAPEQTRFGEKDAGSAAVVFFPRRGRRPRIHREAVGRWRWHEEQLTDLGALRALRDRGDLRQSVLRLKLDMKVGLEEYDEVLSILGELKGTAAAHGRVGIIQVDRGGLILDTSDVSEHFADLPEVLVSVVERLKAEEKERPEVAKQALVHLRKLVRPA